MATSSTSSSTSSASTLGVGSGLDLSGLLDRMRTASEAKLTLIKNQQTAQTSRLSAYASIQSAVEALQTSVTALQADGLFQSTRATASSPAFTATSTSAAIAGSYSVSVKQLAQAQSLYTNSTSLASSDAAVGSGGTVTFTLGDGSERSLALDGDVTLAGLVTAINADTDLGVQATLVNTGSSVRLMLTSSQTGTDAALTGIAVAGNDDLQGLIGYSADDTSNLTIGTAGQNAQLSVNGLAAESQGNTVENLISGVQLTLSATTDTAASLTISHDTAAISSAVQSFVTAYNNVQSVIKKATAFDVAAQTQAALTGDSTARTIASKLRQSLQAVGSGSAIQTLSAMGITTQTSGSNQGLLSIDTDKLSQAIENHADDVEALFSADDGIAARLTTTTESMLDRDGLFEMLKGSINSTSDRLQKQYEAASARIDVEMAGYRSRFVALDALVSQMSSLSSYLTTQLSALSSSSSS